MSEGRKATGDEVAVADELDTDLQTIGLGMPDAKAEWARGVVARLHLSPREEGESE